MKAKEIRYNYEVSRWNFILRVSNKEQVAKVLSGQILPLSYFQPRDGKPNYEGIHDDWKLLGAIACECETSADYVDALDMLSHVPKEAKKELWQSFPDRVKERLRAAVAVQKAIAQ